MLVLSRKKNESIIINDDITVIIVEIRSDQVRLGIEGYDQIRKANGLPKPDPVLMDLFQYEAIDATGQGIKDTIEATSQEVASQTIRQMGYFPVHIKKIIPDDGHQRRILIALALALALGICSAALVYFI